MESDGKTTDFLTVLTRVCGDVAYDFTGKYSKKHPGLAGKKMMPWIASRLRKNIIFTPK